MEVLWCRICETNRKASDLDDDICCNVCGLVLRTVYSPPVSPSKQHPVHTWADDLAIFDEYASDDAMLCYQKASSGSFDSRCELAAICFYIGCRANEIPIMLLDLSIHMGHSVYYVGLMFLDVCQFLNYRFDDDFWLPDIVDPVFFIHGFALFKENNFNVLFTALRILAAFKSEYVGCRERLGGLCAAAVCMAAHFNGLDVDNVVPAFEAILSEKLVESSRMILEEFRSLAGEHKYLSDEEFIMGNVDVLCPHDVEKFCHGFCRVCYNKFVKLSGCFSGESDACRKCPPTDLENGIAVPREDDCKKMLSSMINFDALREVFGDDEEESNASSNAMEQGQAREGNCGDELANGGDAQGREDPAYEDDQREEVLANKARGRFGKPKRPCVRRSG